MTRREKFRFNYSNYPRRNNRLEKITDHKYSTTIGSTFFRLWLHPLFGGWTPYFLSIPPLPINTHIHLTSFYFVRNYLLFWTNGRIRGGHVHRRLTQFTVHASMGQSSIATIPCHPSFTLLPRPLHLLLDLPRKRVRAEQKEGWGWV